jgi:hypothetical protein
MRIKFDGSYKRMNDRTRKMEDRFRYVVTGTKDELLKYEEIKGEYHRTNESGDPLFFSQNFLGQSCELKFTLEGDKVYPDTSELDIAKNLISQNEGALATEMAKLVASHLLSTAVGRPTTAAAPVPTEGKKDPAIDNL